VEFLNSSNLETLNQGNEPTFFSGGRLEVIHIILGSFGLLESITSWEVSSEPSLLDHRHILFTLQDTVPVRLIRNARGHQLGLLSRGPEGQTAEGPSYEHEILGWIGACHSLGSAGPNFNL